MSNQIQSGPTASERFAQLPEFCFVFTPASRDGQFVHAVRRGEAGFFATTYDEQDPAKAESLVKWMNDKLEVSDLQAACMESGALFGFDIPAASPRLMRRSMAGGTISEDRRFVDDGRWFVEAGEKGERLSGGGFLYRRAVEGAMAPDGAMCVGEYAQQADGRWVADIAQEWDAETKTDSLRLGVFGSRNEAILALWEHRREVARERGTLVTDHGVSEAWSMASNVASQKGEVAFGSMCEGREFCGKVLHVDPQFVVQSTGRESAVVHASKALSSVPAVGEVMTVRYNALGRGAVQEREAAALER